jgi:hypothetical protein
MHILCYTAIGYYKSRCGSALRSRSSLLPAAGREARRAIFNSLYSLPAGTVRSITSLVGLGQVRWHALKRSSLARSPGRVPEDFGPASRRGDRVRPGPPRVRLPSVTSRHLVCRSTPGPASSATQPKIGADTFFWHTRWDHNRLIKKSDSISITSLTVLKNPRLETRFPGKHKKSRYA